MCPTKMLIVDDEPIICRGLRYTIPWDNFDIEVVDVSHDGEDAIQKVQNHGSIDIIITDVKMPNTDGLGLAGYLHEHYPEIQIIMISGYDEFSYAQKAIKLGVKDYLLKPVDVDELVKKVLNLTSELEQKQKEAVELQQMGLTNAIFHQISDFTVRNADKMEVFECVKIYPFISLLPEYRKKIRDMSGKEVNDLKLNWKNFMHNTLTKSGFESISIFTTDNVLLTSIIVEEEKVSIESMVSLLKHATFNHENLLFIWSDSIIDLVHLNETFIKLTGTISYLPLQKDGSIYCGGLKRTRLQAYPYEIEKKLIDAIFQFENIEEISHELFHYFESNEFFLEEIVKVCSGILGKIMIRYESLRGKETNPLDFQYKQYVDVMLFNSYHLLQELFEDDLRLVISKLDLKKVDHRDWIIERAENYIKDYFKSTIKASEVANVINISPNYFSSLFKQRTGKNFNEYVNQLRIEEAKILLAETPFKVNEISEQVGFHEYKYFVEVFKKFSGMTPTDYRKWMSIK